MAFESLSRGLGMGFGMAVGGEVAKGVMDKLGNQMAKQGALTQNRVACQACGTVNDGKMKFCGSCGKELTIPQPLPAPLPQPQQLPPPQQAQPQPQPVVDGIVCACGFANEATRKFCCECGAKLEAPVAPAPAEELLCGACGAVCAPGKKFCTNCGGKL
ncbi:MAG: zinc ribbon domain-containing protein [Lachnospiraceae bacterium]|jgi:membrane protease subunit (stomatin/prohibitin family)|nr:zinc ribbon domain-containing protein [Lachnospiraceae bacterium]